MWMGAAPALIMERAGGAGVKAPPPPAAVVHPPRRGAGAGGGGGARERCAEARHASLPGVVLASAPASRGCCAELQQGVRHGRHIEDLAAGACERCAITRQFGKAEVLRTPG